MNYTVTVDPARQVIELEEVKNHLRVDGTTDDGLIGDYLAAAIDAAERFMNRPLITQTLKLTLDEFPASREIEIARVPVQSVSSVKYYDVDGAQQTLSSDDYFVDTATEPARVRLKPDESWPDLDDGRPGAVEVTFVAGYGDTPEDIPGQIAQGILFTVAHFFTMREPVIVGTIIAKVPQSATWCFDKYRLKTFA